MAAAVVTDANLVLERGNMGGVPAVYGKATLVTTGDWINTGLSKITNVQLCYGTAGATAELIAVVSGGKVTITGTAAKVIYFQIIGLH